MVIFTGYYRQTLPRWNGTLANEGTLFNRPYTGTSVCPPCRSVFDSGLHSGHCPMRGNFEGVREDQYPIDEEIVTVGEIAKNTGYRLPHLRQVGHGLLQH